MASTPTTLFVMIAATMFDPRDTAAWHTALIAASRAGASVRAEEFPAAHPCGYPHRVAATATIDAAAADAFSAAHALQDASLALGGTAVGAESMQF